MSIPTNDNYRSDASFWAFHPFTRSIGTALLCGLFSNTTSWRCGAYYGGLSGLINLALRQGTYKAHKKEAFPENQAMQYLAHTTIPWMASAAVMNQVYKYSLNEMFYLNPRVAVATALAVEILGSVNKDLLENTREKK